MTPPSAGTLWAAILYDVGLRAHNLWLWAQGSRLWECRS
jgi:hypothetical protein